MILFAKKERNLWETNIENFYRLTDFYGWNPALGYLLCNQRVTLPGQQRMLTVPILILWTIPFPILSVWQTTPFNGIKKTRGIWIVTTFLVDLAHIFFHGQPVNKSMRRGNKFDDLTRWSCTHFFHGQPVNKSMRRGNKLWRPYSLILHTFLPWTSCEYVPEKREQIWRLSLMAHMDTLWISPREKGTNLTTLVVDLADSYSMTIGPSLRPVGRSRE